MAAAEEAAGPETDIEDLVGAAAAMDGEENRPDAMMADECMSCFLCGRSQEEPHVAQHGVCCLICVQFSYVIPI